MNITKFWIHLKNLPENGIAKQCLQDLTQGPVPGFTDTLIIKP